MMDLSQHSMLILVAVVAVTALALSIAAYVRDSDPGALSVETGDIQDGAVTSAKIGDGEVKTVNLADGNVTQAKLADGKLFPNEKITAARTLLAADHGKTFLVDASGGAYTITLPTDTTEAGAESLVGTVFYFSYDVADGSNNVTIAAATGDQLDGLIHDEGGPGSPSTGITISSGAAGSAVLAAGAAVIGDHLEVRCTHGVAGVIYWKAVGYASV